MSDEKTDRWEAELRKAFKELSRTRWDKGQGYEAAYSLCYDKLARIGKRYRLKGKYRQR